MVNLLECWNVENWNGEFIRNGWNCRYIIMVHRVDMLDLLDLVDMVEIIKMIEKIEMIKKIVEYLIFICYIFHRKVDRKFSLNFY